MLSREELQENVSAYRDARMSLEEFENWFEDASSDVYGIPELRDLCAPVDAALAEYHFDRIGEDKLRDELGLAIFPFALGPVYGPAYEVVYNRPLKKSAIASPVSWLQARL